MKTIYQDTKCRTQNTIFTLFIGCWLFVIAFMYSDSLLKNNDTVYTQTKRKQFQKHDLITIIISENTVANIKGATKADRRTRWEWALNEFIRLASEGNITETKLLPTAQGSKPKINMDNRLRTDNLSSMQHSTSFVTKLQAEVVEILPNGNLILEAKKAIKINDEEESLIVKGIVAQDDVNNDNTVNSEKVASIEIKFDSKGVVGDNQRRGWLTKLLNSVWPF